MRFQTLMDHEQNEIKKGVKTFDPNNSGAVISSELGNILRWLKLLPTEAEIAALKEELDPKHTGVIRLPSIYNAVGEIWPSNPADLEGKVWGAFLTFDTNDKGRLSQEEIRDILLKTGLEPIPENEVKKLLKEHADPKEGLIEYGTLIRLWMK